MVFFKGTLVNNDLTSKLTMCTLDKSSLRICSTNWKVLLTSVPREEDAAGLMISARYLPSSYVEVPMAEQIGLVGTLVLCTLGNP